MVPKNCLIHCYYHSWHRPTKTPHWWKILIRWFLSVNGRNHLAYLNRNKYAVIEIRQKKRRTIKCMYVLCMRSCSDIPMVCVCVLCRILKAKIDCSHFSCSFSHRAKLWTGRAYFFAVCCFYLCSSVCIFVCFSSSFISDWCVPAMRYLYCVCVCAFPLSLSIKRSHNSFWCIIMTIVDCCRLDPHFGAWDDRVWMHCINSLIRIHSVIIGV